MAADFVTKALDILSGRMQSDGSAMVHCPAHEDKNPSLNIKANGDKLLVHCYAGCSQEAVVTALKDLGLWPGKSAQCAAPSYAVPASPRKKAPATPETLAATYIYKDADGEELFQVHRHEAAGYDKTFRQWAVDPETGAKTPPSKAGVKLVPYNLPGILDTDHVVLVEGEKDADCLISKGMVASTTPMGAGNWKAEYAQHFKGKHLAIIPDRDKPGQGYRDAIITDCLGVAASIRVVDLSHGKDVSEYLDAGGTIEQVRAMIQAAHEITEHFANSANFADKDSDQKTWDSPISLDDNIPPAIDPSILSGPVGDMARAVSVETETPIELPMGIGLSAIAAACQGKIIIKIKPGYHEPLNLWVVVALDPANRKTSVLSKMTAPLTAWEYEQHRQMEPWIKEAVSRRQNQEARLKSLRTKYGKAKPDELTGISAEILEIENNLEEAPVFPKVWAQDVTPEHLGTLMAQHNERMSIISAEGGIFDIAAGRYSSGVPNLDLFLQGHAGDAVRVDRGSREPVYMDHPALTFGLSPQPGVLRGLADKPGFRSRGLLARFNYFLPESKLGYRELETTPVPESVKTNYHHLIFQLLNIEPGEDEHCSVKPHVLTLSNAAYQEWADFYMAVEKDLRDDGRFEHIRDWAGKLPGAAARIAGLLHCADNPHEPWTIPVSLETMTTALEIATAFANHAEIAFDLMGADRSLDHARKVWRWVERNRLKFFGKRDCFEDLKGTFKKVKYLEEPLDTLVERNYLQAKETKSKSGKGRHSIVYYVNPEIIGGWS